MRLKNLIFALILTFEGFSQPVNSSIDRHLRAFLATTGTTQAGAAFHRYLDKLQLKKSKIASESDFLRYAFNKTQQTYLKRYTPHASFATVFENGDYNCLTGTVLYSLILSHFNIPHQVIETNYHIFILAQPAAGEILIEATDPLHGFVTNREEIEQRIIMYKTTRPVVVLQDMNYYEFTFDMYSAVTAEELTGLLYYNLAIEAYNKQRLQAAVVYLNEAIARYASPRIEEFARILLITVHESNLAASEKSVCKKTLQTIRYKALPTVAGLQP